MFHQIRLQCAGFWISSRLACLYIYLITSTLNSSVYFYTFSTAILFHVFVVYPLHAACLFDHKLSDKPDEEEVIQNMMFVIDPLAYNSYKRRLIFLKLYVPCIILQYVYKPTRCTKFL